MIRRRTAPVGAMILTLTLAGCQSISRTVPPTASKSIEPAEHGVVARIKSLRREPRRARTASELGFPSASPIVESQANPAGEIVQTAGVQAANPATVASAPATLQADAVVPSSEVVNVEEDPRSPKRFGELLQRVRRRYSKETEPTTVVVVQKPIVVRRKEAIEMAGLTITQKPSTELPVPAPADPASPPIEVPPYPGPPAPLPETAVAPMPPDAGSVAPDAGGTDLMAPQELSATDPSLEGAEIVEVYASPADGAAVGFGPVIPLDENYGVGADQAGLIDNISARAGAGVWSFDDDTRIGFVGIVESTAQIGQTDLFVQGGVGTQNLGGDWPITGTIGMSKLARIEGDEVVKPLVLSFAYDSFYDDGFLDTNKGQYLDQYRVLMGWALSPRLDVGVWGAISGGWATQQNVQEVDGRIIRHVTKTGFTDRAAGYASFNLPKSGAAVITSAGWQQYGAGYFAEADTWVPLNRWLNLWGGVGYSGNNAYDGAVGLEVVPAGWVASKRYAVTTADACDPCDPCCDPCEVCCATYCSCGPRYRGGWANGVYRGALRVMTPARAQRTIDSVSRTYYGPIPNNVDPTPPPGDPPPPTCPDGHCHGDDCMPRIQGRPTRQGNLTTWMNDNGYTSPTNIQEP